MKLPDITNEAQLAALVHEIGFLPMFQCRVPGFSLEDCTPKRCWFVEGVDGPWEWKGRVLDGTIAYGKVFEKRAGFIDAGWLPDFCNYRRDGYDFEGFYEDGFASYKSKALIEELQRTGPLISRALKERLGYGREGEKGFDGVIALLQMQSFVTVKAFEYALDRHGRPYGWGLARYALMEQVFGEETVNAADNRRPAESFERILTHIGALWPEAEEKQLVRLLR
ncbi:MAG: hypothetical protein Q4C13_05865 [Clostridia bacterium]|nr:hypothetical protein [Clostridia bacterium]